MTRFGALRRFSTTTYAGPSYEKIQHIRKEKLNPALLTYYKKPMLIHRGSMQYLYDENDRELLDLFGGIVTVSVGHCHPKVNEALKAQVDKLWHTTNIYMTPPIHEYAEKLTSKLPSNLNVCYFVNSGSEANDLALLMARLYTGRFEVVSLRNAYHGMTQTVMGATNLSTWKQPVPLGFGISKAMNADPYRGPWGGANCRDSPSQTDRSCDCAPGSCNACDRYVEQLQATLDYDIPKQGLAAFMLESVQGVGGTVQFPRDYVRRAFELAQSRGGLCIADEVQTGFGRLGSHYWGFEAHGARPDIVTMAKGIGNGFPLGAVVTSAEIAQSLTKAIHFNTYGGNPLACAAGSAVIDVIDEEKLQQNSADVGTYFINELQKLKQESPIIGDVRGKGLMIGVELVDKETGKPLNADSISTLFEAIKDAGILIGNGGFYKNVLRIKPPMCITRENVDFAMEQFRRILA